MDYFSKYLKYKNKYIALKNNLQKGGSWKQDNSSNSENNNSNSGRGYGNSNSNSGREYGNSNSNSGRGYGNSNSGRGYGNSNSGRGYGNSGRGYGNSNSGRGDINNLSVFVKNEPTLYKCSNCGFETSNKHELYLHARECNKSHKKSTNVSSKDEPTLYKCSNCGFEASSARNLYLHTYECNKLHRKSKESMSFRFPMHATPELVAQTFNSTYNPHLTIKIDGIFYNNKSTQFFNRLPPHWRSIEGELYRPNPSVPPLLFIFKITVPLSHNAGEDCTSESLADPSSKELSITEMMRELNHCASIHLPDINSTTEIPEIPDEPFNIDKVAKIFADHIMYTFMKNLGQVFRYRDTVEEGYLNTGAGYPWEGEEKINNHVTNCKWVPKLYIDLMPYIQKQRDLSHIDKWNLYVKTLDNVLQLITTPHNRDIIKHDGLVITPNPPNKCCLVKIKPKEEMTIDLRYNGNGQFISGEGNDVTELIDVFFIESIHLDKGSVYRCYPNERSLFIPREKREEGKSANGLNHCYEIQRLHRTYFNLSELVDIYKSPPWYVGEEINREQLKHLYAYSQEIYKAYIHLIVEKYKNDRTLSILDIGCGSAGQYAREFNEWTGGYLGIDIDISKLAEGKQKFQKLQGSRNYVEFIPINISIPWEKNIQDRYFNDQGLWRKYYGNNFDKYLNISDASSASSAAGGGAGGSSADKIFKIVLSIFSSHYSNNTKTEWDQYVREINDRTEPGSELFIIFLDTDKIETKQNDPRYSLETRTNAKRQFTIRPLTDNITRGTLTINPSPQGGIHTEPILRSTHIRESFRSNFTIQDIPEEIDEIIQRLHITRDADTTNTTWNNYIDCISWLYLIKN